MKKLMLLTSAAVLVLASCSEDEIKEVSHGRGIDFRAETVSRASETNSANLASFYATAFKGGAVYADETSKSELKEVLFKNTDGFFYSDNIYYWPDNENTLLNFVAYAPATTANGGVLNGDLTLSQYGLSLKGFAPRYDVTKQIDFIHATGQGTKGSSEKNGVALAFSHALSQIEVRAKNGSSNQFKIGGVKIVGAYNSADYDMTNWSTAGKAKGSYKITHNTPIVLKNATEDKSIMGEAGPAMLIPQQLTAWDPTDTENTKGGAYIAVKINLKNNDGNLIFPADEDENAYGWVAVPISTNWDAGKKYIYTLDFGSGAGVVAPPTGGNNTIDPGEPGDKDDKDHPKNDEDDDNDDGDEDEKKPGGKKPDAPDTGDEVLGSPIRFTVTVTTWTEQDPELPDMN